MYQIYCQNNLFKIQYKIISFFIITILIGCNNKSTNNYENIIIDRFEKKFFNIQPDSLKILINQYPYLFPSSFSDEEWLNIKNDSIRKIIFNETQVEFKNDYLITPFIFLFLIEIFPLKSTGSFFTTGNTTYLFLIFAILLGLTRQDNSIEN